MISGGDSCPSIVCENLTQGCQYHVTQLTISRTARHGIVENNRLLRVCIHSALYNSLSVAVYLFESAVLNKLIR